MRRNRQYINYYLLAIILISVILRLINLTADTPVLQLFTDEGFKTFDARNKVLFGEWSIAPHPPCYLQLHPVFTIAQYAFMSLFGVGFIQARLISVIFGLGILLLLIFLIRKKFSDNTTIIAGILFGFNFYAIMISRTAVIEISAIFFMLLTVFTLVRESHQRLSVFAAGIATFLGIITKLYAIFLIPMGIVFLVYRKRRHDVIFYLTGFLFAFIVYALLWCVLTDFNTFADVLRLNINIGKLEILRDSQSIISASSVKVQHHSTNLNVLFTVLRSFSGRFIYIHHLFTIAPGIFILCAIYFIQIARKNRINNFSDIEILSIAWIIFGGGILSVAKYTSFHHLIILLPPMVILSSFSITQIFSNTFRQKNDIPDRLPLAPNSKCMIITQYSLSFAFSIVLIQQIIYTLLMTYLHQYIINTPIVNPDDQFNAFAFLWFIIKNDSFNLIPLLPRINVYEFWRSTAALVTLIGAVLIFLILKNRWKNERLFRALSIAGMGVFLFLNTWRYTNWTCTLQHTQLNASRRLGQIVNDSRTVIGGQFLGLENSVHFAHHHEPGELYQQQAQYLIELVFHPLMGPQLPQNLPDRMNGKKYIEKFIVREHIYHLYELTPSH